MVSSVIYKQIKKFKETFKDKISYIDLNYKGIDQNGSVTINDGDCIIAAYQIWLLSDLNSYHRNPDKGGFMVKNVVKKPFRNESCDEIVSLLKIESNKNFPNIVIDSCSVKCNFQTKKWEIRISAYDKENMAVSKNISAEVPSAS